MAIYTVLFTPSGRSIPAVKVISAAIIQPLHCGSIGIFRALVPVKLLLQVALSANGSSSAVIGTVNCCPQDVHTATAGVLLSHLVTLIALFGIVMR